MIIGADKNPLAFLKQEFPQLKTIVIPGYEVTYDEKGSFFNLFRESVRFNNYIKKEHELIDDIITENSIEIIISDNRYGLWSKKVRSIIITHQLFPKVPIGSAMVHKKIESLIANFDECWIPDIEGEENLSSDLAHLKQFNHPHRFIGTLSRFPKQEPVTSSVFEERKNVLRSEQVKEFDVFAILSGPEPQRTIFEEMIIEQLQNSNLKAVVVRGLPNCTLSEAERRNLLQCSINNEIPHQPFDSAQGDIVRNDGNIEVFNHLDTETFLAYFQKSKVVVCRSGYSSIMDLLTLNKKAILVPTSGQTEQEYLANYHSKKGNFYTQKQHEFNLEKGLKEAENYATKSNSFDSLNLEFLL